MRNFKGLAGLTVATIGFIAGSILIMHVTVDWALRAEARDVGQHWSQFIQKQIATDQTDVSISPESNTCKGAPADQLRNLIFGIVTTETIFQIDVIDPKCACFTSFGKTELTPSAFDVQPEVKVLKGSLGANLGFPIDWEAVGSVGNNLEQRILLRENMGDIYPQTFVEFYSVINGNNGSIQVLRQLINRTEQRAHYSMLFLLGAMTLVALFSAAFYLPVRKYFVKSKIQKESDIQSRYLAHHDMLTGLLNRNGFQEIVPQVFEKCRAEGRSFDIILFDLDNLKEVNDFHSHQAGDNLLRAFSKELKQTLASDTYLSRIGGDEFAVILEGKSGSQSAIGEHFHFPTTVQIATTNGSAPYNATISAGHANFPKDANSFDELMRNADLALYAAKAHRDGSVSAFKPEMRDHFLARVSLRQDFQRALSQGEIVPYYQPLQDINSGDVHGFEALARWNHPEKGVLTPDVFGELFDDPILGPAIGARILDCIINDMKSWTAAGVHFRCIGLNVAACDLRAPNFANNLCEKLKKNGISGKSLAIEITENCLLGANKAIYTEQLLELRRAGCWISLDDFGTGYSSITQIKDLPITGIKIDKSFIDNVLNNHSDQAIVSAMVGLGASLGFSLIAEGIEDAAQLNFVRKTGIELAQGYYFGRPMPSCDVREYISGNSMYVDEAAAKLKFG